MVPGLANSHVGSGWTGYSSCGDRLPSAWDASRPVLLGRIEPGTPAFDTMGRAFNPVSPLCPRHLNNFSATKISKPTRYPPAAGQRGTPPSLFSDALHEAAGSRSDIGLETHRLPAPRGEIGRFPHGEGIASPLSATFIFKPVLNHANNSPMTRHRDGRHHTNLKFRAPCQPSMRHGFGKTNRREILTPKWPVKVWQSLPAEG